VTVTATIAGGLLTGNYTQDFEITITESFVPVTGISGVPSKIAVGNYTLTGTVAPANASNKSIEWSVKDAGTTGASISVNTLNTTAEGTVTITATIVGGLSDSEDYAQDFDIETIVAVTEITGIPAVIRAGEECWLYGYVEPDNATNQDIEWTVKSAGVTGATISDDILLTTTAAGTVVITATVTGGLPGGDYTQDFTITVRSVYAVGSYQSGGQTKACYWKDGEYFDLDSTQLPVGIVFAGGHFYIAGSYLDSDNRARACYWVDGGNLIALPDGDYQSYTTSIVADGSTVYIVGGDMGTYPDRRPCYWKIEGSTVTRTVVDTEALRTQFGNDATTGERVALLGSGFAVDNGNVYIPIEYQYTTTTWNAGSEFKYYMYKNENFTEIDYDWDNPEGANDIHSIRSITVLNGTVYIAGYTWITGPANQPYIYNKPFYGVLGSGSYTILPGAGTWDQGRVYATVVLDDGSLRFYGIKNIGSNSSPCYWDAEGNSTQLYGVDTSNNTIAVTYSDGIVYIAFRYTNYSVSAGYMAGEDSVQLYGSNDEENVTLTGIAVK